MQELGKQQENLTDLGEDFGKDYDFSAREPSDAPTDFSTAPGKPHEHSGEGPASSYTTNGPFRSVGETGDSGMGQKPFPPRMDARLFGGFRDPGNPFAAAFGQSRAFHQDHSSVSGLTAEDIDKARQAKAGSEQKPYKQMVCLLVCLKDPKYYGFYTGLALLTFSFVSLISSSSAIAFCRGKRGKCQCSLTLISVVFLMKRYASAAPAVVCVGIIYTTVNPITFHEF